MNLPIESSARIGQVEFPQRVDVTGSAILFDDGGINLVAVISQPACVRGFEFSAGDGGEVRLEHLCSRKGLMNTLRVRRPAIPESISFWPPVWPADFVDDAKDGR